MFLYLPKPKKNKDLLIQNISRHNAHIVLILVKKSIYIFNAPWSFYFSSKNVKSNCGGVILKYIHCPFLCENDKNKKDN